MTALPLWSKRPKKVHRKSHQHYFEASVLKKYVVKQAVLFVLKYRFLKYFFPPPLIVALNLVTFPLLILDYDKLFRFLVMLLFRSNARENLYQPCE